MPQPKSLRHRDGLRSSQELPSPHDYLHALADINGALNWPVLVATEYVFHLGIAPVGFVVAAYLFRSRDALPTPQ